MLEDHMTREYQIVETILISGIKKPQTYAHLKGTKNKPKQE